METKAVIRQENVNELIGQIIDIFEDFLDEKGITIANPEKEGCDDNPAVIYGSDYGDLEDDIRETLANWNIIER